MCFIKQYLVIGFSAGSLVLYDTLKREIVHSNFRFTKDLIAIDKLE